VANHTLGKTLIRPFEVVRLGVWLLGLRRSAMAKKRHKPEEIVAKLRQVDVLLSQGVRGGTLTCR